jgi:multidrug efflux pump subunit AcrB
MSPVSLAIIMSLIGVILLVGIVAKNAVLLIDFAKCERETNRARKVDPAPAAAPKETR